MRQKDGKNIQPVKSIWSVLHSDLKAHILHPVEGIVKDVKRAHIKLHWKGYWFIQSLLIHEKELHNMKSGIWKTIIRIFHKIKLGLQRTFFTIFNLFFPDPETL